MNCKKCGSISVKNGRIKSTNKQRYYCKSCNKSFIENYTRKSFGHDIDERIISLVREGCGTRSISRILKIAPNTVTRKIVRIGSGVKRPPVSYGKTHEVDELITYIGKKENRICVAYAIDRITREVVDFSVGRRNKSTLNKVIITLLLADSKEIRTDKLSLYQGLIPTEIHYVKQRGINHIERMNLNLRTHLKRLSRRTIAFTRHLSVLTAVLRIYFWESVT